MRSLFSIWQLVCSVALSCALNGVGVALVTLAILAWNNLGDVTVTNFANDHNASSITSLN
jgi:hypothetical protein